MHYDHRRWVVAVSLSWRVRPARLLRPSASCDHKTGAYWTITGFVGLTYDIFSLVGAHSAAWVEATMSDNGALRGFELSRCPYPTFQIQRCAFCCRIFVIPTAWFQCTYLKPIKNLQIHFVGVLVSECRSDGIHDVSKLMVQKRPSKESLRSSPLPLHLNTGQTTSRYKFEDRFLTSDVRF